MHKKVNLLIVYTNRRVSKAKQNYSTFSRIITFYDKNINGNKNYALHYSETSYKYALAPRRALVYDESDGADAPPRQAHATKIIKTENQTERRGGAEPSPLNRFGIGCRFFRRVGLSFIGFYLSLHLLNLLFRSAMVA